MRTTKEIVIKNVIVDIECLRSIARYLSQEHVKLVSTAKQHRVRIAVGLPNSIRYESDEIGILSDQDVLGSRPIEQLTMEFQTFEPFSSLELNISATGWENDLNTFRVVGEDSAWVNGTSAGFVDILSGCEKPSTWVRRWQAVLGLLFALTIGWCVNVLISTFLGKLDGKSGSELWMPFGYHGQSASTFAVIILASILVGLYPSIGIINSLLALYPSVELRTGADYNQILARRRKKLTFIMILLVAPLLVNIMSAWLGNVTGISK